MKYYQVKAECDGVEMYSNRQEHLYPIAYLIGGELYTVREFEKLKGKFYTSRHYRNGHFYLRNFEDCFKPIEISKNKTFFCFGARLIEGVGRQCI